jgi:hypothetical protein
MHNYIKLRAQANVAVGEDFLRKLRALKPGQRARVLGALDAMIGAVKQ